MSTPFMDGKKTSEINKKASALVSFRHSSFQEGPCQLETFDLKIYENHILKTDFETTSIDSIIFDDPSKLDLSSIHDRSQDD